MERFKRTIKKVAALAGGALMVGSAMAGALAALDDLPQPFVTSAGVFDSYVVVGTLGWNPNAAFNADAVSGLARDISSGIDVGASFAQISTSSAAGGAATTTVSEGVMIDAAGDPLNYNEDLYDVDQKLTDKDLDMLADGTFKDTKGANKANTDFNQELKFTDGTATLIFGQDAKADDKASDDYLKVLDDSGKWAYTFTVDFDDAIAIDTGTTTLAKADLNQNKIKLLGKTYTMSETDVDSTNKNVTAMTLLSGAVTATQGEYTTQTYTLNGQTYEVEVLIISDSSGSTTSVKFRINGETTDALIAAETYTLADGTVIGVEELLPNEGSEAAGADQVSFYLGANKITLDTGKTSVKLNDNDVKDSDVTFETGGTAAYLDKINVMWKPTDDTYMAPGEELEDPIFGSFKFVFAGVTDPSTESILITPDGSEKVRLVAMNKEGDTLDFDVFYGNDTGVYLGEDSDNPLVVTNLQTKVSTDIENLQGVRFLYDYTNIAHLIEITSINADTNKTSFKVLDTEAEHNDISYTQDAETTFTFMDQPFKLVFNESYNLINFSAINDNGVATAGTIETKNGAVIEFQGPTNNWALINITEVDAAVTGDIVLATDIQVNCSWDGVSDEMDIASPSHTNLTLYEKSTSDKDNRHGRTPYGTYFDYYSKDQNDLAITYPDEEVTGEVYVSPTGATTTTTTTSGSVNVNYINAAIGISRTDADFATAVPTKNVVLLGGPTVNELVNDLVVVGEIWILVEWVEKVDIVVI
jgi:hypothetical protein